MREKILAKPFLWNKLIDTKTYSSGLVMMRYETGKQ
jgi:hypothetical protein